MTTEIKNIMSPVRIMKVEDWSKIALAIMSDKETANGQRAMWLRLEWMEELQQRYELLTSRKLEKGQFVCEMEKPTKSTDEIKSNAIKYVNETQAYESALKKVWFAGFEIYRGNQVWNKEQEIRYDEGAFYLPNDFSQVAFYADTVFDFIYHITKYNETSPSKIQINFTDSFINELIR